MDVILSLLPSIVAIVMCLLSRQVISSLFVAILVGSLILADGNVASAIADSFVVIKDVMIEPWKARYIVLIMLFGGGAALIYKTGGAYALTHSLSRYLGSGQRVQLFTWGLGVVNFFNSDVNAAVVGNASKNINADKRVSREKLAYILDSTASPVSTFGPVSDWIGYQVSIIAAVLLAAGISSEEAYSVFIHSLPWNAYCALAFLGVPMMVTGKDFGPMARAELRARKTGKLVAEGDQPLSTVEHDLGEAERLEKASVLNFILPVVGMMAVTFWGMWWTGGGEAVSSIGAAISGSDISIALTWGSFAMVVIAVMLALKQGFSIADCEKIVVSGAKSMLPSLMLIILAWSLGSICIKLDVGGQVIQLTQSWISTATLPALVFLVAGIIAFSTGSSWGTMAIVSPVALALAYQVGNLELLYIASGALFSGAVFGDHCSPISDSTIMASIFSGSDHIAHVLSQLPYALISAFIALLAYLLSSIVNNGFLVLGGAIILQYCIFRMMGNFYQRKYFSETDRLLLSADKKQNYRYSEVIDAEKT